MASFLPAEKGTPIRMPSTANLMIDSYDRDARYASPFDFQIVKSNSILNGFFTRIATAEVVLEWNIPNGIYLHDLGTITVTKGATTLAVDPFNPIAYADLFYTAEEALDRLVEQLNTDFSTTVFEVQNTTAGVFIGTSDSSNFTIAWGPLAEALGFGQFDLSLVKDAYRVSTPDLRPTRYLDFVSAQLTYNQDLKDSSTATTSRDVLCRWYFAWDTPPIYDGYGFPILMGYKAFQQRRTFSPPKQIKWDPRQPMTNLSFQVYGVDASKPYPYEPYETGSRADWLMTLQVSED